MEKNTDADSPNKTGDTLLFDMSSYLDKFRRQMASEQWDEFKLVWRSRELLLDFARNLCTPEESIHAIARGLAVSRKSFVDWLCLGAELDYAIREEVAINAPEGSVVIEISLVFDRPHLLIRHYLPRTDNEIGFERYIERCRREHEPIHPEVDRQLRLYRSTQPDAPALVFDSRRFRS